MIRSLMNLYNANYLSILSAVGILFFLSGKIYAQKVYEVERQIENGQNQKWEEVQLFENGVFRWKKTRAYRTRAESIDLTPDRWGIYSLQGDMLTLNYYNQFDFKPAFITSKQPRSDSIWKWTCELSPYKDTSLILDPPNGFVEFDELDFGTIQTNRKIHHGEFSLFEQFHPLTETRTSSIYHAIIYHYSLVSAKIEQPDTACMIYKTGTLDIFLLMSSGCCNHSSTSFTSTDFGPISTAYNYHTKIILLTDCSNESFYAYLKYHGFTLFEQEKKKYILTKDDKLIKYE